MPRAIESRRTLLKAAGISISLPAFVSLKQTVADDRPRGEGKNVPPMRMVCIGNEFGMYPEAFWPSRSGRDYEMTPLLEPLSAMRDQMTVFSHLDHGLKGGHFAVHTFLTGVKSSEARSAQDGGISLDQRAAEYVGSQTRFPALTIGSDNGLHGGPRMSWTRTGTRVPPVAGPRELFRRLFINESAEAKRDAQARIGLQGSILDAVGGDAKSLARRLNPEDKQKLEEYLSSVRDVEKKLQLDQQWNKIPKPDASIGEPRNEGLAKDLPKIYDLIALALQTDSTRIATLEIGGGFVARDIGINKGYHGLSHHGKKPDAIKLLVEIEKYQVEQFARFLSKLESMTEPGTDTSLLDRTMTLFGSGMGNANSHTNHDLPVILAGGGFRHGEHMRFPDQPSKRIPLANLFVSMLQNFGVETDRFSNSSGTLRGLELA